MAIQWNGILFGGVYHQVPGLRVASPGPGQEKWISLSPRDYEPRSTSWIRMITLHSTQGKHPTPTIPGAGKGGTAHATADFWRDDPRHSAAQIIVDDNRDVFVLCDLKKIEAYHASTVNPFSIGIEQRQRPSDGGIFEATYQATMALVPVLCKLARMPLQHARRSYNGSIIKRLLYGGQVEERKCVGIFGHRDNAWDFEKRTSTRGRGDPGDEVYRRLEAIGSEGFDYDAYEDITTWQPRQQYMNTLGEKLDKRARGGNLPLDQFDGVCGPGTYGAMERHGFANGHAIDRAIANG